MNQKPNKIFFITLALVLITATDLLRKIIWHDHRVPGKPSPLILARSYNQDKVYE